MGRGGDEETEKSANNRKKPTLGVLEGDQRFWRYTHLDWMGGDDWRVWMESRPLASFGSGSRDVWWFTVHRVWWLELVIAGTYVGLSGGRGLGERLHNAFVE